MEITTLASIILFVLFFFFLFLGVPISISLATASFAAIVLFLPPGPALFAATQQIVTGIDDYILLAVIFFMLAGSIMNNGGIALRLVNLAKLIGGRMTGSLAHTNVLGNMLFGSISGSAIASAATMGRTMSPIQKKEGYDPGYSAAVNISSAPMGLIIPPSGMPILFSLLSGGTSIGALFLAGYLPGILMAVAVMMMAYILAKRANYPVSEKFKLNEAMRVIWQAGPSLLLIIIVVGGIAGGIFTATEASAVAVLYSLGLCLIYRSLSWSDAPKILKETFVFTGIIMFLVGASAIMSWVLSYAGIPQAFANTLLAISDNYFVLILAMVVILLVIGTFMDVAPALLVFTPILLPVATEMGMDPVHFGLMMMMALAIGVTTPPVGTVLFIGSSVSKVSIERIIPPLLKFYTPLVAVLLLVAYIPSISLWLPGVFGVLE
ncbi:TRAP transporter large permease [Salsuginibacillus kocurii]|uniref:TRAP transporter large permease n=1 Tax=Salsuginibacillus kocurii TaxID=427078 RepID=UPI00036B0D19|nr:TRAP transporter large permease [Salsuginibacillus kocurii]